MNIQIIFYIAFQLNNRIMKVYYKEFEDLSSLNDYIKEHSLHRDIISISYIDNNHLLYYWYW